jgi:hypothetical protein
VRYANGFLGSTRRIEESAQSSHVSPCRQNQKKENTPHEKKGFEERYLVETFIARIKALSQTT